MRLRISLFELLLLVTPACAIVLGLLMAVVKSPDAYYVLTIAQGVYLAAMLAAVCALFHRAAGARVFAGAFLAASLGHFLLLWLANQSVAGGAFPTTFGLARIWDQLASGQTAAVYSDVVVGGSSVWSTAPPIAGGYSGGMFPGGMPGATIPIYQMPVTIQRPLFVEVGIWAVSLLLGVLCGVVARSLRGSEPDSRTAAV